MVLLGTGTLVPAEKFTVRMPMIYDVFSINSSEKLHKFSIRRENTFFSSEYSKIMHSFKFRFTAF